VHIRVWLDRVEEIVERGRDCYLADGLLQEAGDSLMMKLGEAANRLSRLGVLAPEGVEWALAVANPELHHPPVRRAQPRAHLEHPLGTGRSGRPSLTSLFQAADAAIEADFDDGIGPA
jgi:hypothetical protein